MKTLEHVWLVVATDKYGREYIEFTRKTRRQARICLIGIRWSDLQQAVPTRNKYKVVKFNRAHCNTCGPVERQLMRLTKV